jgi:hypothetical protein
MVDLSTRDDEQAREREQEREKGRIEEQDLQRERDLEKEKGRKQGLEEEKAREKGQKEGQDKQKEHDLAIEKGRRQGLAEERRREDRGGGLGAGIKVIIALIVIALIVVVVAFLTLTVSVTQVTTSDSFPFTTSYGVSFPEGQTVTIGNTHITVLSYQNDLISDIDGDRQKLTVGVDRGISERRAVITTLGAITLMDTYFLVNLTYKGVQNNRADFDMAIRTSKQVPNYLIQKLLPPEIDARPI